MSQIAELLPTPGANNAGRAARTEIRAGRHRGDTAGLAPGYVQANLAIVPADWAVEFAAFCQRNPKPCPLLDMSAPGEAGLPRLGADIDLRTDLPRYRVFRDGELVDEVAEIGDLWRDDFVAFALGCSYSFEEALVADGLDVRHLRLGRGVPMYVTDRPTLAAGRFSGPLVVSMRPFKPAEAIRAILVTGRFPAVHGAPVHFGDPAALGIADLGLTDYGGPMPLEADDVPLFWACGVTPQAALARARPPLAITHSPGHMLVTDRLNTELAAA